LVDKSPIPPYNKRVKKATYDGRPIIFPHRLLQSILDKEGGYNDDYERQLDAALDFEYIAYKEGDSAMLVESYFIKYPEYDSNSEISRVAEEAGLAYNNWDVVDLNYPTI